MTPIFGNVNPPPGASAYGDVFTGLVPFLNNILRLIFVIAGLFAFFNLILGGLGFISAGGDPKAIEKAWAKIYQSLIGLIIIVSSFILAAVFGYILFGSTQAILYPRVYGPPGKCDVAACSTDCNTRLGRGSGGFCSGGQCFCNP